VYFRKYPSHISINIIISPNNVQPIDPAAAPPPLHPSQTPILLRILLPPANPIQQRLHPIRLHPIKLPASPTNPKSLPIKRQALRHHPTPHPRPKTKQQLPIHQRNAQSRRHRLMQLDGHLRSTLLFHS
jgi:hypothetical protein